MSGQWWENDLLVGPFADIDAANAWAAANPSSLFPGLLATAAGVQVRWGGVGVGWYIPQPIARSVGKNASAIHVMGDSITTRMNGMQWADLAVLLSRGRLVMGVNAATSGAKIEDLKTSQLDAKLKRILCDEVWIQIGTNNSGETISVCEGKIADLVSYTKSAHPNATIRLFSIPPSSLNTTSKQFVYKFNAMLSRFAGIAGCAFHSGWEAIASADGGLSATYDAGDGFNLHPGLSGQLLCATARVSEIVPGDLSTLSPTPEPGLLAWEKSLMLLDSDSNGVSDTWNNYTAPNGGSSVAAVEDTAIPYIGKWQRRTFSSHPSGTTDISSGILADPGSDYVLSLALKFDYQGQSGMKLKVVFSSGTGTAVVSVGEYILFSYGGFNASAIASEGVYTALIPKEYIPDGTKSIAVYLENTKVGNITATVRSALLSVVKAS